MVGEKENLGRAVLVSLYPDYYKNVILDLSIRVETLLDEIYMFLIPLGILSLQM